MAYDWRDDYLATRDLDERRALALAPLTFGRLRLTLVVDGWIDDFW